MNNKHCYYYKYIKQENGIFENIVDAVFIILLENSDREENVYNQLKKYNIHSNVIIQYNKGFKLCKKKLKKQITLNDIIDSFNQVFYYSKEKNYKNILVLEDDFIITNNINKKEYLNAIKELVTKNKYHTIHLGGLSKLDFKYNKYINKTLTISTAHAVIYNQSYFDLFLKSNLRESDGLLMFSLKINKYNTNIPLIVQPFTDTENRKNWRISCVKILDKINNINWEKNYEGFELEYWNRYNNSLNKFNKFIKFIIIIIVVFTIYIISVKSKNFRTSSGNP